MLGEEVPGLRIGGGGQGRKAETRARPLPHASGWGEAQCSQNHNEVPG